MSAKKLRLINIMHIIMYNCNDHNHNVVETGQLIISSTYIWVILKASVIHCYHLQLKSLLEVIT